MVTSIMPQTLQDVAFPNKWPKAILENSNVQDMLARHKELHEQHLKLYRDLQKLRRRTADGNIRAGTYKSMTTEQAVEKCKNDRQSIRGEAITLVNKIRGASAGSMLTLAQKSTSELEGFLKKGLEEIEKLKTSHSSLGEIYTVPGGVSTITSHEAEEARQFWQDVGGDAPQLNSI
jgi:predicted translin family RNA/ssDNA-binding protein